MTDEPKLSMAISLAYKKNLGNYESVDFFVSLSGITSETTEEEISELLDGSGELAYQAIRDRVAERSRTIKRHE